MKSFLLLLMFFSAISHSFSQDKAGATKLIEDGVALHDKGQYEDAIARYDKALKLDKDNLLAMVEKAFSLSSLQKYSDAVKWAEKAIATHPGDEGLVTVYVTLGNAFDGLKKPDKAIAVYDEGIALFPDYAQLHFNKGITLSNQQKNDLALASFERSVRLNPGHPGSHNAIGQLSKTRGEKIPSLLALCRFMVVEPQSARAKANLEIIQKIMLGGAEKTGDKSVNIVINADKLDTNNTKEDNFNMTELLLAVGSGLDYEDIYANENRSQRFLRKFKVVCSSLGENVGNNKGFFHSFYAPYFIEMQNAKMLEPFAYVVQVASADKAVMDWVENHQEELKNFFTWSDEYWKQFVEKK